MNLNDRIVVGLCREGNVSFASDSAAGGSVAGLTEANPIGKPLWELFQPAAQQVRIRQTFGECLLTGERQSDEFVKLHGAALERWRFRLDRVNLPIAVLLHAERLSESDDRCLTKRERQVVSLMIQDYTVEEIADALDTRASTVTTHQANIRQKLGCSTNVGVAMWGIKVGLGAMTA